MKPPRIIIIRSRKGLNYANFIAKEINLAGHRCLITDIASIEKDLIKYGCSPDKTIIHSRTAHPKIIYKKLNKLERLGYRVINNSESLKLTSDKYASCVRAKTQNIPCAETVIVEKKDAEKIIQEKIKLWGSIIVKPQMSQGNGTFCFKFDSNNFSLDEINKIPTKNLIVQKYINYQRLNRVLVINKRALRKAVFWDTPDDWKCSVCLNSRIKVYSDPDKNLLSLAEDISHKFDSEISFIDIFTTDSGYVLSEINSACSLIIHERLSGYNISKDIASYLVTQM